MCRVMIWLLVRKVPRWTNLILTGKETKVNSSKWGYIFVQLFSKRVHVYFHRTGFLSSSG